LPSDRCQGFAGSCYLIATVIGGEF
jgi:hypothetical protein